MNRAERILRARIGAYSLHSQGKTNTGPARAAFFQKFFDEVDPGRVLPEIERERRAAFARSAYYSRLALKAAKTRQRKKNI